MTFEVKPPIAVVRRNNTISIQINIKPLSFIKIKSNRIIILNIMSIKMIIINFNFMLGLFIKFLFFPL